MHGKHCFNTKVRAGSDIYLNCISNSCGLNFSAIDEFHFNVKQLSTCSTEIKET